MLRCRLLLPALSLLALALFADARQPQPAKDLHGDPLPPGAVARMGQDRWLHGINANFAAFLPDGKTVVTVNSDNTIRVWEFPSGKELRRVALPGSGESGVFGFGGGKGGFGQAIAALAPDGKTIATSSIRGEISFHDVATGNKLPVQIKLPESKEMPKGKGPLLNESVQGLAFSPNGKQLASITARGDVILWDWANAKQEHSFAVGGNDDSFDFRVVYAPDGKSLATSNIEEPPMGKDLVVIKLWDAATAAKIREIRLESEDFVDFPCVAFSPDSKTIAATVGQDITLVEAASGKEFGKLSANKQNDKGNKGLVTEMSSVCFNKDGSKVYATGYPTNVMEWEVATRKLLRQVDVGGGFGDIIALSPDDHTVVVTGRGPQFYDLRGKDIETVNNPTPPLQSVHFLTDGKTLITSAGVGKAAQGSMQKWDAVSGKNLGIVDFPFITSNAALSPDGKVFAALSKGAKGKNAKAPVKVLILDAASGKELGQIELQPGELGAGLCFSPDGTTLAVAQPLKQKMELYEVATSKLIRALDVVLAGATAGKGGFGAKAAHKANMLFSNDGKTLAWSENRVPPTVVLFDTTTGKKIGTLTLPQRPAIEPFAGAGLSVSAALGMDRAAFSPDGRCLALDMEDGTAVLYELATGQQRMAFGKKLSLPKAAGKGDFEATMVLLNSQTKARTCFAISPDGRCFAHSGTDGVVHLFDALTGNELKEFKGHAEGVNALAFAPNGKTLASASADSTALIWDVSKIDRPATAAKALKPTDLESWWQDMAGNDATKAFAAMSNLVAGPKDAMTWIKERVKPAAPVDAKRAEELLAQLDSNQYKVRELANNDLLKMGEQVVPLINKALAATPPLETKQRLELLRGKLTDTVLRGEQLRAHRAVEVLELIGTPEARQVLQGLANGAPGALLTSSAQAALKR